MSGKRSRRPDVERGHVSLAVLFNADARTTSFEVRTLAAAVLIPHPLTGVEYADGAIEDTTAGHVSCTACRVGRPCKTKRKRQA